MRNFGEQHRRDFSAATVVILACLLSLASANAVGQVEQSPLDDHALEALAAPVALYPDELLAIVLQASTYPLDVVQASRFLKARASNPSMEVDPQWHESLVALLNYPEALALLNDNLDWTADLGTAVLNEEKRVLQAVGRFRERAYRAGNLKSDDYKTVQRDDGTIAISSSAADTLYVPYYEPAEVIYARSQPVYRYYSNPYPVYYYPYNTGHRYYSTPFWGVTTAFTIGWLNHRLNFYRHGYRGHPYAKHRYDKRHYRGHNSRARPRHRSIARRGGVDRYRDGSARHGGYHSRGDRLFGLRDERRTYPNFRQRDRDRHHARSDYRHPDRRRARANERPRSRARDDRRRPQSALRNPRSAALHNAPQTPRSNRATRDRDRSAGQETPRTARRDTPAARSNSATPNRSRRANPRIVEHPRSFRRDAPAARSARVSPRVAERSSPRATGSHSFARHEAARANNAQRRSARRTQRASNSALGNGGGVRPGWGAGIGQRRAPAARGGHVNAFNGGAVKGRRNR